jgi:hypothetical protein
MAMSLLRALARMVGVVWMLVLALFGLAVAMYCVDALVGLGSIRPDRLLHLPSARDHVGRFLDQLAAPGSIAGLALLCGLGAMLLGILLLVGLFGRRRQRLVILDHEPGTGAIAARRRPLGEMARALGEPAEGATRVQRPKLALSRRGRGGTLKVDATRARSTNPQELTAAIQHAVEPITEPFGLRAHVRLHVGETKDRAQ